MGTVRVTGVTFVQGAARFKLGLKRYPDCYPLRQVAESVLVFRDASTGSLRVRLGVPRRRASACRLGVGVLCQGNLRGFSHHVSRPALAQLHSVAAAGGLSGLDRDLCQGLNAPASLTDRLRLRGATAWVCS
jgi:hypothetical protein